MIYSPALLFAALSLVNFANAALDRTFSAAPKHPSLKRSSGDCSPGFVGHELVFVEDAAELFVATVKIEPTEPMLILEDLDDHIQTVKCSMTELIVEFYDRGKAVEAATLWKSHESFVVVTHQPGCQIGNEHTAWSVTQPSYQDNTVSFSANPVKLREKANRMSVELGKHLSYKADLRRLAARQATVTTAAPEGAATGSSVTQDISFSFLNATLLPPPEVLSSIVKSPDGLLVSCIECTVKGSITLSAGAFDVDGDGVDVDEFFSSGYVQFEATDFAAHMDFQIQIQPGFEIGGEILAQLPDIQLGGINIQGLIQLGPILEPKFPLGITMNSTVTFTTGFTISAPPTLSIYLNVSDPLSSETHGWSDATLDALPFTADADGLAFDVFVGFRPELKLQATANENGSVDAAAMVGVRLELPKLMASIAPLTTSTSDCQASSDGSTYLLTPSVMWGELGFIHDVDTSFFGLNTDWDGDDDEEIVFLNGTTTELDPQCLKWDATARVMQEVVEKESSNGNGSGRLLADRWSVVGVSLVSMFVMMCAL